MFGIAFSVKSRVSECTPALLYQAIDDRNTHAVCAEIADALEMVKRGEMSREDFETLKSDRKRQLPILTPHATFRNGRRVNDEAVPSGLSMYDVDHISDPRGYYQSMVSGRETELGIAMAHVTPSTEGLRLFFIMPEGMTLAEAQQWMSRQLGDDNYDGCVKDLARCSFLVPRDYILYMDEEELFNPTTKPNDNEQQIPQNAKSNMGTYAGWRTVYPEYTYKGHKVTDIIDRYMEVYGTPEDSQRHLFYNDMVTNFRHICNNQPDVLADLLPPLDVEAPMEQVYQKRLSQCQSICRKNTASRLPHTFYQFLLNNGFYEENVNPNHLNSGLLEPLNFQLSSLPLGLKESLIGVPENMHMPVICGVMPIAAAYADQVEVEYCDGNRQHLGLMSIIYGEQASNKSVVTKAINVWKRQFKEEDALARKREDEWKERKKNRKANEKGPDDPKVLIREMPVTVSCSTLLKRMKNAQGHTLYSFGEELDTLRKTNGAGSWSSKYDIYRLAFDRGEWGQDYNSDQAESGVAEVAYNWTMLGTQGALNKCFKADNIENGLSSRVLVAQMPDSAFARLTRFKRRSEEEETRIQEAVTRLRSYSGYIDTPRLRKAIEQWVEEKRVEAAKDIDRVKDTYRKRAAVIGFRCGVIYRLLEGRESKACLHFALTMAQYCLDEQIKAFGETLSNQYVSAQGECQRYGSNHSIFDQLPPTFTYEDIRALKRGGCSQHALHTIVYRWKKDGWIDKVSDTHWTKRLTDSQLTNSH